LIPTAYSINGQRAEEKGGNESEDSWTDHGCKKKNVDSQECNYGEDEHAL
jgi:hypothetical protein